MFLPAPGLYLRNSHRSSTYSWLGLAGLRLEGPVPGSSSESAPGTRNDSSLAKLWTAPVLFYERDSYLHLAPVYFSTRNASGSGITRFGPGYYYERDVFDHSDDADDSAEPSQRIMSTLVLPGFYRSRSGSQTYTNVLLAGSWESDKNGLESVGVLPVFSYRPGSHFYAFPVYYGRDGYDRSVALHLLPGVFSWYTPANSKDSSADFAIFAAGLYIRRAPEYQRENLLYLIDRQNDGRTASLGLLLHSLSYESESHAKQLALGYGFLAGLSHRRYPKPEDHQEFEANLLWLTHESQPDYLHNSFIPLWYYDRDKERDSSLWAFAPLLSGASHDGSETIRLFGGGALYYEFSDADLGESSRGVLLGALYSDTARRERGYRSRGSLWNYLWQYQSESESDFEKFSLLKFVYSRTRHEGRTRTRVLGVRVHES